MADPLTPEQARIAIEDTQQWLLEAVVGLNLCPFAKAVVVKDRVRYRVCPSDQPEALLAMLRDEVQHLAAAGPDALDTTLLMAPRGLPDFLDCHGVEVLKMLGHAGWQALGVRARVG